MLELVPFTDSVVEFVPLTDSVVEFVPFKESDELPAGAEVFETVAFESELEFKDSVWFDPVELWSVAFFIFEWI